MKCLVTTLDGIVNDSSLPIFSALNCTSKTLQIWSVEPCPIYANGALRGEFSKKTFIETDAVNWSIRNRYALSKLMFDASVVLDVSELTYMSELVTIDTTYSATKVVGTWPSASNFPKLETITCGNSATIVNFDDFGYLPKIKSILMPGSFGVMRGSLEQFVKNQRSIGNTSGSVSVFFSGIKWQGVAVNLESQTTLSWTETTISFNGTTITA